MKKILCYLICSVVIFTSLFVITPIKVSAATQQDAVNWAYSQIGSTLGDGWCVDFTREYCSQVFGWNHGSLYPVGGAIDYSTIPIPSGWTRIENTLDFLPQPGDIGIWGDPWGIVEGISYGHVGVIISSTLTSCEIINQRWDINNPIVTQNTVTYNFNSFWGVLRPPVTQPSNTNLVDVTSQFSDKTIAIKSVQNGNYVSAWMNETRAPAYARVAQIGEWEKFQTIGTADGWVGFKSATNGKFLSASINQSNTPIEAVATDLYSWECFKIYKSGSDYYIKAQINNNYLTAFVDTSNTPIRATQSIASTWERFNIIEIDTNTANLAEGRYYVYNVGSGKYLDTYYNGSANETNIDVWDNDYTAGLKFSINIINGAYLMKPDCGAGRVVNVYTWGGVTSGQNVCLYDYYSGDTAQLWEFENLGDGAYIIRSKSNPSCVLTATGSYNGANVNVQTYTGSDMQKWTVTCIP